MVENGRCELAIAFKLDPPNCFALQCIAKPNAMQNPIQCNATCDSNLLDGLR